MTNDERRPAIGGRRWIVILSVGLLVLGLARLLGTGGDREASEGLEHGRIDILGTEKSRYSQVHEEVIVRDFFQDRRGGVFLDVGAAHAITHSTTLYLEQHLGWTGISVDALEEFRQGYEKHRPNTKFFNYIVTDHSGTVEDFYRLGQLYLMSTQDKQYAETFGRNDYEVIQVTTITLDELLDQNGVTHVDFVSMDIELGEPAALAGFDIERFAPELVCVEANKAIREKLLAYFSKHDYVKHERYSAYDDEQNWYFTRAPTAE